MKASAIRTWALIVIVVAGLLGATSVLGDKSLERVRDEHRRQAESEDERGSRPVAGVSSLAQDTQSTAPSDDLAAAADESQRALVRRYIPLVVPALAVLLLVCIATIWRLSL